MALSIRNKKAERLAREVAEGCGTSMTQVIIDALEEKKQYLQKSTGNGSEKARLLEIQAVGKRCAALPDKDTRPADEILGYNDRGVFHGR
jgi:antitoxin VapB